MITANIGLYKNKFRDFYKKNTVLVGVTLAVLVVALPWIFTTAYERGIFVKILLYVILASSLNVINGYSGQFNIGHAGLVCIGSYTAGIMSTHFQISFWIVLLCSALVTALAGYLISRPVIRLEGTYLSIVTMGIAEIIRLIALNWDDFTGGPMGIRNIPRPTLFGFVIRDPLHYYYLALFLVVLTLVSIYRIINSRVGRTWISIREDQVASRFLGVDVDHYKTLNFVTGSFFAGIGGCFLTYYYQYIASDLFTVDETFNIMSMVIIGGQGTLAGPIVGSIIVNIITEAFRFTAQYRFVIYAIIIIVMMWKRPQGLVGDANSVFAAAKKKKPGAV